MQTEESKIGRMLAHPAFDEVVYRLAGGFLEVQRVAPRLASQFSTQQRWLLSHAALSRYFRGLAMGRPGLSRRDFVEDAQAHRLASRNTAQAFFAEALKYGIVLPTKAMASPATLLAAPAPEVLWALNEWYLMHLGALDALDAGDRAARLLEKGSEILPRLEPAVSDGLLASETIRAPVPDYAVFASVDDGGTLMDRLIAGLDVATARDEDRALTNVTSVSALARSLNLSRTHAGRTLAAAIARDSLGWSGAAGRSPLWLSRGFRTGYAHMQAAKLVIIGEAFDQTTGLAGRVIPPAAAIADATPAERSGHPC